MKWRTWFTAGLQALVFALLLSALGAAQGRVYLPHVPAGQGLSEPVGVSAAANGQDQYRFTGETASAYLYSADECSYLYGFVFASDSVYHDPPGGTKSSYLVL